MSRVTGIFTISFCFVAGLIAIFYGLQSPARRQGVDRPSIPSDPEVSTSPATSPTTAAAPTPAVAPTSAPVATDSTPVTTDPTPVAAPSEAPVNLNTKPQLPPTSSPCQLQPVATLSAPPTQYRAEVHPTNYGDRYQQDINGQRLNQDCLVVLHETAGSGIGTISEFQTAKPNDADQASYHALINRDGTIVYLVPPEKRAYGAGNSVFVGPNGPETVKTNPKLPVSVNNFAYHISLESPPESIDEENPFHNGYTDAQYDSLAWLVASLEVSDERIATHAEVDQSGQRVDPQNFDLNQFLLLLRGYEIGRGF